MLQVVPPSVEVMAMGADARLGPAILDPTATHSAESTQVKAVTVNMNGALEGSRIAVQ
jgi:hypothetical protein